MELHTTRRTRYRWRIAKRAFITGVAGQDGAYLSALLLQQGYEVHGTSRQQSAETLWRLDALGIRDQVQVIEADILDAAAIDQAMAKVQPDEIYNFAAQSFVGGAWEHAQQTCHTNAVGMVHLLDAMQRHVPQSRLCQASSGDIFDSLESGQAYDEQSAFRPRNPYGSSKLCAHWLTVNYREHFDLFACCSILFNHESPLRGVEFVTRKITDGVARIHYGLTDTLALGNLDTERDWGFAGDYVEAMWRMLQQDQPDDYVVATGQTHSIRDILDLAFAEVGISDWSEYIVQDPRYVRSTETQAMVVNNHEARTQLQWEPTVDFASLIKMMMAADLERLKPKS